MREKIKPYLEKVKAALKKIPKMVFIALAVLLVAAVAVVVWLNNQPYAVLFTDLNTTEISSILTYMEESGVTDYKVQENDTILVPPEQEESLKAQLLMAGYPESGYAYTYSSSTGALSTESERNQAVLQDLQERMGAVVRNFEGVREAVVTINLGEDTSYILDGNRMISATASVFVTMNESTDRLTDEQVAAIRRLVAHSVKGLEVSAVTVEDAAGNTYSSVDSYADSDASALKLQLEEDYENKIRTQVLQALIPFYGEGNVKVGVSCTVDISQVVEQRTDVYLPEYAEDGSTNGQGIIGSRIYNYVVAVDEEEPVGGIPGTSTNSDFPEYVEDLLEAAGAGAEISSSGQVDYDNSRSEKNIVSTAGYLTDVSVSVSINSRVAESINVQDITLHVARAAGIYGTIDEATNEEYLADKISVISAPFYEEPAVTPLPGGVELPVDTWVIVAAVIGLLLFLIILLLILRRRKKKKQKKLAEQQSKELEGLLAAAAAQNGEPQGGADVMSMQSEKSVGLRQDIRKFAEENPQIAAQMIKAWLRGDDDNG